MKENTYAIVAWRMSLISNNKQLDKYKALIEKLIQLGASNWPKFQKLLGEMHLAEMKPREPTRNVPVTHKKNFHWQPQNSNPNKYGKKKII